jgi:excisionase family DNA binding protein
MNNENSSLTRQEGQSLANEANGRLYTVSQAAAILHLAEAWIYERTRKKAIPHRKLGKHIRFTDSDLSAIVQMGFRGPKEEIGIEFEEQLNA